MYKKIRTEDKKLLMNHKRQQLLQCWQLYANLEQTVLLSGVVSNPVQNPQRIQPDPKKLSVQLM
jgi:hypothetical protein